MAIVTSALFALAPVPQPISLVTPAKAFCTWFAIVAVTVAWQRGEDWNTRTPSKARSLPAPALLIECTTTHTLLRLPKTVPDKVPETVFQSESLIAFAMV